jgi:hypothetical protein
MRLAFSLVVLALALSSCALSHERPSDDVAGLPAELVGDWTFAAPICDSINRVVWVTLCADGEAWLSDHEDWSGGWQTFAREATPLVDGSVRFEPIEPGNAFESTTLAFDRLDGRLVERVDAPLECGEIESHGERGRPASRSDAVLPSHPCS